MWTAEEDSAIMDAVLRCGQKWQTISECLPGRSANAVRNRFLRCYSQSNAQNGSGSGSGSGQGQGGGGNGMMMRGGNPDLDHSSTGALVAAAESCRHMPIDGDAAGAADDDDDDEYGEGEEEAEGAAEAAAV